MQARLKALADIFPHGNTLIDIGSDHGHLGLELLKTEKALLVWNVDLSKGALKKSQQEYKKLGYENKAVFIYSDGFEKLDKLPNNSVVVIAGMGSYQILKILNEAPEDIKHLILLSHTDYSPIRKWAKLNGWDIRKEKYVLDRGYVYIVMDLLKIAFKTDNYSKEDYIFGQSKFRNTESEIFKIYWKNRAEKLLKIPQDHRSEEEQYAIEILKREKIIEDFYI